MKKSVSAVSAIIILLLLLTHSSLSYEGACQGLLLWFQTVLPTLLPFMLFSSLIVKLGGIPLLIAPFRPILTHVFKLSDNGCYVLISGLLCGYPMGAKTCSEFLDQGLLSPEEARYLLAISNHPSPMFLLGYATFGLTPSAAVPAPAAALLLSLYLPILPLSFLARKAYDFCPKDNTNRPEQAEQASFDTIMMNSFEIMVKIGGYIMLFSILAAFIRQTPAISSFQKAFFLGLVEITTGIQAVKTTLDSPLKELLLTMSTAFGGLSGLFQTKSVLKNSALSMCHYTLWKILHTALSMVCFFCITTLHTILS